MEFNTHTPYVLMWGNLGSTPGLGRSPGEGNPLHYSREYHGLYSPWGHKELDQLSDFHIHP